MLAEQEEEERGKEKEKGRKGMEAVRVPLCGKDLRIVQQGEGMVDNVYVVVVGVAVVVVIVCCSPNPNHPGSGN